MYTGFDGLLFFTNVGRVVGGGEPRRRGVVFWGVNS